MLPINRWFLALLSTVAFSNGAAIAEDFSSPNLSDYDKPSNGAFRQEISDNANEYIDPFSGTLRRVYTELVMPGQGGLDLVVQRYYNNKQSYSGTEVSNSVYQFGNLGRTILGLGWDLHFGRIWLPKEITPTLWSSSNNASCQSKFVHSDNNPVLELADGSRQTLVNSDTSDFAFISKQRWIAKCLPKSLDKNNVGGLLVYSPDGKEYTFNQWGILPYGKGAYYVTKIADPSGNEIEFNYSVEKSTHPVIRLLSVKTNDGRKLTFNYDSSKNLIDNILTNDGRRISFSYQKVNYIHPFTPINKYRTAYFLSSVKRPDGSKWSYQYTEAAGPERYSLKKVTSPIGMQTSYNYARVNMSSLSEIGTHVVTRKEVRIPGISGSKEWTYSYTTQKDQQDMTHVIGPYHCEKYYHIGQKTITTGTNGVNRGLWQIGNLVRKQVFGKNGSSCKSSLIQEEFYAWNKQHISSQNEVRIIKTQPGTIVDEDTYTPLLTQSVIKRDGRSYTTTYSNHDQFGNPATIRESGEDARVIKRTYFKPSNHWMIHLMASEQIEGGASSSYSYTNKGLVSQVNKNGVITKYTYSNGDLATQTDANGKVTQYQNYYRGIPQKTIYPDGSSISRTTNPTGTVATETNANGNTTVFSYDKLNRLTQVFPPKKPSSLVKISYTYTGSGLLKTVTRGGFTQQTTYNALGLPYRQVVSGSGSQITQTATYDVLGRQTSISYPTGSNTPNKFTRLYYDALGRLTAKVYPDGTRESISFQKNTKQVTDANGYKTSYVYRSYGHPDNKQLMEVQAPENVVTTISRNKLGMVASVTQGGLTRRYQYDSKLFLASENNPETGTTAYTYDAVGNIVRKQVGSSSPYRYRYDNQYRLTGLYYPSNSGTEPDVAYQYDALGNVTEVANDQVKWTYQYDANNNLIAEDATIHSKTGKQLFRTGYVYDTQDVLAQMVYPSGEIIDYAPDALGRATKAGRYASGLNYHANGQLSSLRYGNGQTLSISQEANRQRINNIRVYSGHNIVNLAYEYDGVGNITKILDGINGLNNRSFGYDRLHRLGNAHGKWGVARFTYNNRNDILSKQLGNKSYSYQYDGQGRLASVSGSKAYQFSYNPFGSVAANGHLTFQYDGSGVNTTSACYTVNNNCQNDPDFFFRYDGHNRRVATINKNGNAYYSLYNQAGQLFYEEDAVTGNITEYVYVTGQQVAKRQTCSDTDTDGDLLPDCVEKHWGYKPNDPADGQADNDGDGLSNGEEYRHKTNPESKDTDNDGIDDFFEINRGLNPLVNDASNDPDQDGLTNLQEYQADTDPTDSDTDNDGIPDGKDSDPKFNLNLFMIILQNT
ncbi:hypothetical protein [Spartinivicinus poritis]|uniref:Teneurin-like YD-shell domain-containing protein n=1 Tax=Spartinivicinus poritis TaxID=2994640 RepID=A0ABT5UGS2_9GAMM|nr:hypothetical protein [Spartinivicinus sp. A2-2]MDE1465576.1 hypothetical protein [Spartinivicinus sp. A2-2]